MNKLNNSISSAKKIAKTSISGALLSILISCTDNENNNENNNKNYINYINAKQKIEHIYSENSLKEFTQTILPYGLTGNDREDINILNHLATKHFILEQTIKSINPNQIGNMLEYSSPKLNATVIEFIMKCYPLNLILTWPINSRIKIYMLGFATLEELNLTINDLPSNSIEEKVLFHNQGIEKTLEFNESLKLYKNIMGLEYLKGY